MSATDLQVACPTCGASADARCTTASGRPAATIHAARRAAALTAAVEVAETSDDVHVAARTVACPKCKAKPGQACVDSRSGEPTHQSHARRVAAARTAREAAQESAGMLDGVKAWAADAEAAEVKARRSRRVTQAVAARADAARSEAVAEAPEPVEPHAPADGLLPASWSPATVREGLADLARAAGWAVMSHPGERVDTYTNALGTLAVRFTATGRVRGVRLPTADDFTGMKLRDLLPLVAPARPVEAAPAKPAEYAVRRVSRRPGAPHRWVPVDGPIFDALQRHGFRYGELQAHIADLDHGAVLTSDDGYEFRAVRPVKAKPCTCEGHDHVPDGPGGGCDARLAPDAWCPCMARIGNAK